MQVKIIVLRIFYLFIFIWVVLSITRTFYNLSKIITEDIKVLSQTDDQKRVKIFGDIYPIFKKIDDNTSNKARVLLIVPQEIINSGIYYQAYYFLYPRLITILNSNEKSTNLDYLEKFNAVLIVSKNPVKVNIKKFRVIRYPLQNYKVVLFI